jgi:di/tricarboxylate transporter
MLSLDALLVIAIIFTAIVLFALQILQIELTAMVVLALLLVFGLVDPQEAVSGFSNQATVTVAAMFVLSRALEKTGCIRILTPFVSKVGPYPHLFIVAFMLTAGLLSALMNNTPIVAIFLPVIISVAYKQNTAPSRWLIPLSFAAQAGGVCTLIGTSTNLLANSIYVDAGFAPISLFEMGKLGLLLLALTIMYFSLFGRFLLPDRPSKQFVDAYQLKDYFTELRVLKDSPLIGKKIPETKLYGQEGFFITKVFRKKKNLLRWKEKNIHKGDLLLIEGKLDDILSLRSAYNLEVEPEFKLGDETLKEDDAMLTEVLIAPRGGLIGKTLKNVAFNQRYNLVVIAIRRMGKTFHTKLNSIRLMTGDMLLVTGKQEDIEALKEDEDFIVLEEVSTSVFDKQKALLSASVLGGVVLTAAWGVFPIMVSAIIGCVILLLTRCLRVSDAYKAIDWRVIFLLAGMLPLSIAMSKSGLAELIGNQLSYFLGALGPLSGLAVLYLATSILTELLTNNASAVLLVPIAISSANQFGVDPKPFVLAVAFAASTSYMTPIGYQTNAMILTPGGYHYTDFFKAGMPLNLLFLIVAVVLIPLIWPFY